DMPSAATAAMATMNLRDMVFLRGSSGEGGSTSHPGNWSHRPPERFMGFPGQSMPWLRAAAVLAFAFAPLHHTPAHARPHHRFHKAVRPSGGLRVAQHGRHHHRFADLRPERRERVASAAAAIEESAKNGSPDVVAAAERYRGTNPTGRSHD